MNVTKPPKQGTGIGVSTTYLLERWITPFALFVGAESMLIYGVLAGFWFALMGFFAFLSFSIILLRVKKRTPMITSLNQWFSHHVTEEVLPFFQTILKGLYSLDIFIVGVGGGVLLHAGFHLHMGVGTGISLLIFTGACWLIGKKGMEGNYRIYMLGFFFALLVFFLVYPFLVNPIQAIYDGIRLYHPYLFVVQEKELFVFILSIFAIFMGRIMISPSAWKLAEDRSKVKIRSTLLLTGTIWAILPIAFTTLLYPVISQGDIGRIEDVFYHVSHSIPFPFVSYLFLLVIAGIIFRAGRHVLHSISFKGTEKMSRKVSIFVVLGAYVFYVMNQPSLLELFFIIGIFYASLTGSLLLMLLASQKVGWVLPLNFILSILVGGVTYIVEGKFRAIGLSVGTSIIMVISFWMYTRWKIRSYRAR